MFDKIHLRSSYVDVDALLKLGALKCPGDGQYRKCLRLSLSDKKRFLVRLDPYYAPALPSIEFNPSRFQGWEEIVSILEKFTDIKEVQIDRIDYAVDVEMPFENAWQSIRIARKQSNNWYEKGISRKGPTVTGFKSGEKPEVFCIYDKGCEVTKKWKFKRVPGAKFGDCTRIELRQYNQKVPFKSLSEITNYITYDPFGSIDCRIIREALKDEPKIREMKIELESRGFDGFFAKYNVSGNFPRTYGRYFESVPLKEKLREDHQSSLRSFLGI